MFEFEEDQIFLFGPNNKLNERIKHCEIISSKIEKCNPKFNILTLSRLSVLKGTINIFYIFCNKKTYECFSKIDYPIEDFVLEKNILSFKITDLQTFSEKKELECNISLESSAVKKISDLILKIKSHK